MAISLQLLTRAVRIPHFMQLKLVNLGASKVLRWER